MRRLMIIAAFVLAALFVQAAAAAPPGATRVDGRGSTVWGDGTQSFRLNVFRTSDGNLGGHMSWHGVTSTPFNQPLDYSGHPVCLTVSGGYAIAAVVHYYPGQVFPYLGAIEIVQPGSPERAWGELLETGDLASAKGICDEVLTDIVLNGSSFPILNGQVTITP